MTDLQMAQFFNSLIVAVTPWCVVRIALEVAVRHAQSVHCSLRRPARVGSVGRLTLVVVPVIAILAVWLPAPSPWMAAINLTAFAAISSIALRALGDISEASRSACEAVSPVRVASLRPRRVGDYVPRWWRIALFAVSAIGLVLFISRLGVPTQGRRLFLPMVLALAAVVFSWLYEVWLRQLTTDGHARDVAVDESVRRGTMRWVFAVEVLLVVACLALAHALLDLDWGVHASWGVAGALVGTAVCIVGCALALSSDLARRRYRVVY